MAYYTLGRAYFAKNDFDNAIQAFEKVAHLSESKGYCWGYVYLGLSYNGKGETKQAIDNLKTALTVPNDSGSCWKSAQEQLDKLEISSSK